MQVFYIPVHEPYFYMFQVTLCNHSYLTERSNFEHFFNIAVISETLRDRCKIFNFQIEVTQTRKRTFVIISEIARDISNFRPLQNYKFWNFWLGGLITLNVTWYCSNLRNHLGKVINNNARCHIWGYSCIMHLTQWKCYF